MQVNGLLPSGWRNVSRKFHKSLSKVGIEFETRCRGYGDMGGRRWTLPPPPTSD